MSSKPTGPLFGIAVISDDGLVINETADALADRCSDINRFKLEALLDELALAAAEHKDALEPGSGLFFALCRRLQKQLDPGERSQLGRALASLGLVYVELLYSAGQIVGDQWSDEFEVEIWFEKAWNDVKFAEDEGLLETAFERAKREGPLSGKGNFGLFVRFACCLQLMQRKKHIYLPVSEKLAALFNVTPMQISNYVAVCERRGYLIKKSEAVAKRKARTWLVNLDHPDLRMQGCS